MQELQSALFSVGGTSILCNTQDTSIHPALLLLLLSCFSRVRLCETP